MHDQLVAFIVDASAERAHGSERRLRVSAAAEASDRRDAVGDGAEQQRPVRDRLVAGDGEVTVEAGRRLDSHSITCETTTE